MLGKYSLFKNTNLFGGNNVRCEDKFPPEPPVVRMWMKNWFGAHDIPSVRRGYEVYRQICSTCHSMKYVTFRSIVNQILPQKRVKEIARSYDMIDGPNAEGEMYTRPGILTDTLPSPYPNQEAAAYANGGAIPTDLSVVTAAHENGTDYIYALLTSFRDPPYGVHLRAGLYYNTYFPGGAISMPPPLNEDGQVEYEDGTPATISQMAKDVTMFLTWATDPVIDERKLWGMKAFAATIPASFFLISFQRQYYVTPRMKRIDFTKVHL